MTSASLFERAKRVIPGGVNSPVRAFNAVGGNPVYMASGAGARMTTVEGRILTDFCGSWGPLVLGHAHPRVVEAIQAAAALGTTFGTNTPGEVAFAELLCEQVPSMDRVRLVNSGTEATMTALRIARGATGRNKIIKFDGCYHGHADYLLVAAGSGLLTGGITASAGVTRSAVEDVIVAPYNDLAAVHSILEEFGSQVAAVIVEPVAGNMGLVPPADGFLEGLRQACSAHGTVLVFDEVINGFRLGPTSFGVQHGVAPDLTCLGKIIGGGLPVGAVGGRAALMDMLAPLGDVYQAGTLSGNPVAVAAGRVTLEMLRDDPPYAEMERLGQRLAQGLTALAKAKGVAFHAAQLGGMFTPFFCDGPVRNLADAKTCDASAHAAFFNHMLEQGFYLPPSQFEVGFVSAAHSDADVDAFLEAASSAFA
ncbi:MAG: glutamate-1-semialdehyde 2,1-aminomutase [Candidatus Promineifilaceae bacterium]|jgi:glutamate-1-semialdehyde 2,1-aminomutase